jgi:hypothetical protein
VEDLETWFIDVTGRSVAGVSDYLTYDMPVFAFEPSQAVRPVATFHDLTVAQQLALREHFETLTELSDAELKRRRAHLREAAAFFREP